MAELKRSLTLLDVASLGVNGVIGSGIFLLPGIAAEKMGPASILVVVFGGVLCFLIALCFAETGSYFSGTGGPYLYAREAFGPFVGFEVGWMTWMVRIVSWAALANAFALNFAYFWPPAKTDPIVQKSMVAVLMIGLALVNVRGAKWGARLTNVFTVSKLVPLLVFIAVGLFFVDTSRFEPFSPKGYDQFGSASVTMLWAFVGFEVLAVPAGEMNDPQRSVPIALVSVLAITTVLYLLVVGVSIGTYDQIAGAENPVAEASRAFMGPIGGALIAAGIAISIFGVNSGSALITPRCVYALAENNQLPRVLAAVHPKYGTPHVAIAVSTVLSLVLALTGSFEKLAVISVVARFAQYIPTCLAVIVLRRRKDLSGGFSLPFGPTIPLLATGLSLWLMSQAEMNRLVYGAIAALLGVPVYLAYRVWSEKKQTE